MRYLTFLLFVGIMTLSLSCSEGTAEQGIYTRSTIQAYSYKSTKSIVVDSAAVVSAHPLASQIGISILRQGGNAVDASIAVQYALAVVYPRAGNLGGGGFMVLHTAAGESYSIDFREKAPAAAFRDMYLDSTGQVLPRKSLDGHLAPGVPGTVAGIFLAHDKWGKLPMKKLIAPAIKLAEEGFAVTQEEAEYLNRFRDDFLKYNTVRPTAFVKAEPWKAGDTLIQKDLARTLERIALHGKAGFYGGETAKLILEEMQRGNGIITLQDLKAYKAVLRKPREFDYEGYRIVAMGLPSSGGILLQQMLGMLEPYELSKMGYHSPETINHVVEAERRAYADRSEYLGDPDYEDIPVNRLISDNYISHRMDDFVPGKAGNSKNIHPGLKESEQTTHLSILDKYGNAVSITTTLNTNYGSRVLVGHAGFFLNNEMNDFSAKPGTPNVYGLLGTDVNAIEAGKRMLSSMTPTIVLKDDKPFMVVGTPGGSTIITSVLQSILNIVNFNLSAEEAVNKPKYHHQWYPDVIFVEKNFPEEIRVELQEMGYTIKERNSIGRTELILVKDGKIYAVGDIRGDDSASGY